MMVKRDLSRLYANDQRHALILENDAVLHTGFGEHVSVPEERAKKAKRKKRERLRLGLVFFIGLLIGVFL